jgi:hypothetical protein
MKKIILPVVAVLLFSCNSCEKKEKDLAVNTGEKEIYTNLYGSWVGMFIIDDTKDEEELSDVADPSKKINLSIEKITPSEATGHCLVGGRNSIFKGSCTKTANSYLFVLKEIGNSKYNGVFNLSLKNDTLSGKWKANEKIDKPNKTLVLVRRKFHYDPKLKLSGDYPYVDWVHPKLHTEKNGTDVIQSDLYRSAGPKVDSLNASMQKLTESNVKNLKKLELQIIRNTIYARHGYSFQDPTYRQFFDEVDWYVPVSKNVDKDLTPLEKENIVLLKRFEKYATDYYDSFGR